MHTATQNDAPEPKGTIAKGRMQPMEDPNGQPNGCLVAVDLPHAELSGALWQALGEALDQGRLGEARALWRLLNARREQPADGAEREAAG